jgi:ATP-dependent DNA helicase DinG
LGRAVAQLGGIRRDGQVAMADAVATALATPHHLLVQAGTGTGKSLAYLIPALTHVRDRGGTVIVATATLALQRQILTSDLPVALDAVGPATVALLKGRSNYLCRHKLAGGYAGADALFDLDDDGPRGGPLRTSLGAEVTRIREWAAETETGDVDDLRPGPSPRAWRQASVSARECLAAKCPLIKECFAEQAKSAAAEADLVVTNHTLLALHASADHPILPEFDALIVDEAHELVDRVTSALTALLGIGSMERTLRAAGAVGADAEALTAAAGVLGDRLRRMEEGRLPDGLPKGVADAVFATREAARDALRSVGETHGEEDGTRQFARAKLAELVEVCDAIGGASQSDVLWAAPGGNDPAAMALHLAPLSVAGMIRGAILGSATTIMTSATLSLGDDFAAAARAAGLDQTSRETGVGPSVRLGLGEAGRQTSETQGDTKLGSVGWPVAEPLIHRAGTDGETEGTASGAGSDEDLDLPWQGLDVGSPFDYRNQGIVYVAADLPPPARGGTPAEQLDTLERLINASGGGALGLFTSRAAALKAAEEMRQRIDRPILAQGEETLAALVERFRDEPDTCLFGTISLWQGVDVPGPSCRLVTIDRIPFPRPDDPIRSARSEAVDRAGGSGFMAVSVSHAALMLAQGSGRLIRRTSDRGVVAILDPRLVTKRYGGVLRRALPPLWATTDLAVTCAALERLRQDRATG